MKGKEKKVFLQNLKKEALDLINMFGLNEVSNILNKIRTRYLETIGGFNIKDPEQSWKPFKGKFLEEIVMEFISQKIKSAGLEIISGALLSKKDTNLDECLSKVKRSLLVDFGEFGMHLPDADLVIYDPKNCQALTIISSKTTLRERLHRWVIGN